MCQIWNYSQPQKYTPKIWKQCKNGLNKYLYCLGGEKSKDDCVWILEVNMTYTWIKRGKGLKLAWQQGETYLCVTIYTNGRWLYFQEETFQIIGETRPLLLGICVFVVLCVCICVFVFAFVCLYLHLCNCVFCIFMERFQIVGETFCSHATAAGNLSRDENCSKSFRISAIFPIFSVLHIVQTALIGFLTLGNDFLSTFSFQKATESNTDSSFPIQNIRFQLLAFVGLCFIWMSD